ncbi:MAG: mechanosensitive ion channel family protein [Treponema sp.]|jgi:MscS family membrane protein|nr:mechanosensitive ion channel family protein [Treponema sp.]
MTRDFLGNSPEQWGAALAFAAGGFIAGILCSLLMRFLLKTLAARTKNNLDNLLLALAKRPLQALLTLMGVNAAFRRLAFSEAVTLWGERLLTASYILVPAIGLSRILDEIIVQYVPLKTLGSVMNKQAELQPVLRRFAKWSIWLLAAFLVFDTLGYDINALLAGLGLGGAALALASKDTLSNFFGSITVFVDKPFNFNDRIKIAGHDGYITAMGLRTSRIRTMENRVVIIPNSLFASTPIENISAEPNTRVNQTLTVKRDGGLAQMTAVLDLLRDIGGRTGGTCGTPGAGITALSGASCQISFVYYVDKSADYLETVNRVNCEILRRFEGAGISLA